MKNLLAITLFVSTIILGFGLSHPVQARGRFDSIRVGGYTSSGKGSHYIGGYVRSCHGWACR